MSELNLADPSEVRRIESIGLLLREAERPVRVLRTIAWPLSVRDRFFESGASELPVVEYEPFDASVSLSAVDRARAEIRSGNAIDEMFARQADVIATSARMIEAVGTPTFTMHSRALYGGPLDPLPDALTTPFDLACQLDEVITSLVGFDLGAPNAPLHDAEALAAALRRAVDRQFGDLAPEIQIVEDLSANALAGAERIRIRRDARFSDLDITQLLHHEAYVHVGSALNGREQNLLPLLAASHAGTTRTQEGLAVFAELVSGAIDFDRMGRLAARSRGIEMALGGADFIEVYRYFIVRGAVPRQAFENARRVFRGGVITGGAPFTKDGVYLDGLLRIHNFLRVAVSAGRVDCIRLLFCGKLDLEDLPALGILSHAGLVKPPRFLPPWAADLRFLVTYLAYSSFLNRIDLDRMRTHYGALLEATPRIENQIAPS